MCCNYMLFLLLTNFCLHCLLHLNLVRVFSLLNLNRTHNTTTYEISALQQLRATLHEFLLITSKNHLLHAEILSIIDFIVVFILLSIKLIDFSHFFREFCADMFFSTKMLQKS